MAAAFDLLLTGTCMLTTNYELLRLSPGSAAPSRDVAPSGLRRALAAARRDGARGPEVDTEADTGGAGEAGGGGEPGEVVGAADGAGDPGALDNPLALAFASSSDREHSAVDTEEGE